MSGEVSQSWAEDTISRRSNTVSESWVVLLTWHPNHQCLVRVGLIGPLVDPRP